MATPSTQVENHALRKLAHLLAGEEGGAIENARRFLVEQAFLEGRNEKSLTEITDTVGSLFSISFSKAEISATLASLRQTSVVEKNGRFSLRPEREGGLKKINSETKFREKAIYEEWVQSISARHPQLTESEREILLSDLRLYINKTFFINGAETGAFIDAEVGEGSKVISTDLEKLLPSRNRKISEVRRIEFPRFFRDADEKRRNYFAQLLDGTFIYNIIQVDPSTLSIIKQNFKNYVFYLDTNILYSLLNLEDSRKSSSIEKTISMAESYGMKIVVSSKTLQEMKTSIEFKSKLLLKSPNIRKDLAELGADLSEEENFTTAYWRAYAKTGVTKEDFIAKFKHIPELLKAKQITVIDDTYQPKNKVLEAETALLQNIAPAKTTNIAKHDAYHRLLISWLRDREDGKGGDRKFWFLSWDSQVATYAFTTRKSGEQPFAVLPHQLMQILRLYSSRTQDYDATFIDLFSKPQIKSAQGVLPNDFAEKVTAKISNYFDLPADLAIKIMMDSEFIKKIINEPKASVQDEEIKKKIDEELINKVTDLTKKVLTLEEAKTKESRARNDLQADYAATSAEIVRKNKTIEHLKIGIIILSFVSVAVINIFLFLSYWDTTPISLRIIWIIIDLILLFLILNIKWKINTIFYYITGVAALITTIVWIASLNSRGK